ncbi:MAG: cobalamin-dependent protein [Microthrixaceae bacterium]|nr:cobalamin-dependent protein [Microthrixaceae bacterium]
MSEPNRPAPQLHVPEHPVRVVTATSLFDGHDAAINIMRRILQSQGAEVIHLGHNRSVDEVVEAVIEEDAAAVAVSSYQGGHIEYFTYLVDRLAEAGVSHVRVYGGGGGVISPEEISVLAERDVRIFSPEDGQRMGLEHMVNTIIAECDVESHVMIDVEGVLSRSPRAIAGALSLLERAGSSDVGTSRLPEALLSAAESHRCAVVGITGTGGSGKSSLTDELLRRIRLDQQDKLAVAVLAVDPNRRRCGGALLGDRIRMNAIDGPQVYFRSVGTAARARRCRRALRRWSRSSQRRASIWCSWRHPGSGRATRL